MVKSLRHCTLNAMLLPAVVSFNASADLIRKENRLNRIAQDMSLASGCDILEAIRDMNARTGLAAMGVGREQFDRISKRVDQKIMTRPDPMHSELEEKPDPI